MSHGDREPRTSGFGRCSDGTSVERVQLAGEGLAVNVLTYGAVIQDVLVQTPAFRGFGQQVWTLEDVADHSVRLSLISPDGEEGYPGTVTASCTYRLSGPMQLSIELDATTDAPTIINLAAHSYFNLSGEGDIRDHRLAIDADCYLPVDDDLIPTGEFRPVANTDFDFRRVRRIGREATGVSYDHNFVIGREPVETLRRMARLEAPDASVSLEVWSTEPGLQFYDGAKIAVPVPGLAGRRYGSFSGLCLEPQRFPDSPNHPDFTDVVLRPGQTYRQITEYRFSVWAAS